MEEGFWGEEVGGGDSGVVDFGDVEVVEDYGGVGLAGARRVGRMGLWERESYLSRRSENWPGWR